VFRVQKFSGETDSPELFPLGSWRTRKVTLEAAIQRAYLCPGSEPGSKAGSCDCWLIAKGRTGDLPSEQNQPTAIGTEGTGCCGIRQEKPPPARRQIYSQQPVGCDPARSLPAQERPQMPAKCER